MVARRATCRRCFSGIGNGTVCCSGALRAPGMRAKQKRRSPTGSRQVPTAATEWPNCTTTRNSRVGRGGLGPPGPCAVPQRVSPCAQKRTPLPAPLFPLDTAKPSF
jgi:hypothetical protein